MTIITCFCGLRAEHLTALWKHWQKDHAELWKRLFMKKEMP